MWSTAFWKRVFTNIVTLLSGTTLARGLMAVASVVIARQIGPEAYGQYSASLALIGLTTVLFALGLDNWLLYKGGRDRQQLDQGLSSALSTQLLFGTVWAVGLWIIAPRLNSSSFPWTLILLGSVSLFLEELMKLIGAAFTALLRNDLTMITMLAKQGTFLGLTIWLAIQGTRGPQGFMAARLAAALVGAVLAAVWISRTVRLRASLSVVPATVRESLPFAASGFLAVIYGSADLTIVAARLGERPAGVYAPATNLLSIFFLVPLAVYAVMVPILSRGHVEESPAWFRKTSAWLLLLVSLIGIALGIGLHHFASPLVNLLFGLEFQEAGAVLAILSGVFVLRCSSSALAAMLVAVGWQSRRAVIQAVSAVSNVTLVLLCVSKHGLIGVARIYVLTELILFLGYLSMNVLWMRTQRSDEPS
jgi:O-antigen/teichoic acid export membrane protein